MRMINILRRRLKDRHGFTLSEMLVATLILLMVSAIVAGGVPAAANAYYKIIDAANAQILLTDTVTSLRRELAVATDPSAAGNELEYTNSSSGWHKKLMNSDKGIITKEIIDSKNEVKPFSWNGTDDDESEDKEYLLVQSKMFGGVKISKLFTSYESITYNNGVFTITNLKVTKDNKDGQIMTDIEELKIQNIVDHPA